MTFGVSGMLWNRSLVMYDADTNSLWSHALGEAMQGELKGTRLEVLPSEMVTWETWKRDHPDTTVLNMSRSNFVERGTDVTSAFYKDPALWVYGWSVGLQRYHVPLAQLQKQPILNVTVPRGNLLVTYDPESTGINLFSRHLGNQDLTFAGAGPRRMRDAQTGSLWDVRTGEAVEGQLKGQRLLTQLGMVSYTNAWESFYPTSKRVPLQ